MNADVKMLAKAMFELREHMTEFSIVLSHELARPEWPSELLDAHENLELWNVELQRLCKKYSADAHNELIDQYLEVGDFFELAVEGT